MRDRIAEPLHDAWMRWCGWRHNTLFGRQFLTFEQAATRVRASLTYPLIWRREFNARAPSSQFYIFDGEPRDNPDALKSVIESKVGVFGAEILGSQARASKQNAPSTPSTHLLLYGAKDSIARAEHTRARTHILLDIKRELIGIKMSICIGIWEWSLPPHNLIECRTLNFATTATTTTTTELLARPTSEHTHTISSLVRRQRRRSAHTHTLLLAGRKVNQSGGVNGHWMGRFEYGSST